MKQSKQLVTLAVATLVACLACLAGYDEATFRVNHPGPKVEVTDFSKVVPRGTSVELLGKGIAGTNVKRITSTKLISDPNGLIGTTTPGVATVKMVTKSDAAVRSYPLIIGGTYDPVSSPGDGYGEAVIHKWQGQATADVNALELTAEEVDVPSYYESGKATTTGDGSQSNPRTLLAGYFVKAAETDAAKHFVKLKLSAYSNSGLNKQEFEEEPEWSVEGGKGDFGSPEDNTGVTVNYRAYQPGKYVFTAKVETADGPIEREIIVYVARTKVLFAPEFVFSEATARVPIKFGLETVSENFEIDEASFVVYRKPVGETEWEAVRDTITPPDTSLKVFGASWDAKKDENGKHNAYCTVSRSKPFDGLIIRNNNPFKGTSGMLDGFALEVLIEAKLKLADGEETNLCTVRRRVEQPYDPYTGKGFTDSRWPVIEIGKNKKFSNGYKCLGGYGRYRHLGSDDNGHRCKGFSIPTGNQWCGVAGEFIAGNTERYTGTQAHYHDGDLSHANGGPRGFDENEGWGADGDHAVAGMTKKMSSTGLKVEARLFDDGDATSSDDEEEYVAKALAGGIAANVLVSYGIKSSSLYGDYMDVTKTKSNVIPKALGNAVWAMTCTTEETSWVAEYGGTVTDTIGAALAVVAVIAVLPNPPIWVAAGATYFAAAGAVTATAAVANDIDGFTAYGDQKAMAMLRPIVGTVNWGNGKIPVIHITSNGQGTNTEAYDSKGAWGAVATGGVGVTVGDRVCTSFDINCTAQNESFDWESTPDVHSKVELRKGSGAGDLRKVEYTWK